MSPPSNHNDEDSAAQTSQSRRRFLLGMGTLTAALAGCIGNDDQEANDTPANDTAADDGPSEETPTDTFDPASDLSYGEWLATDEDELFFVYSNLDKLPEETMSSSPSSPTVDDPLLLYPVVIGGVSVGLAQLTLPFAGLAAAVNPEMSGESTVSELTMINGTVVAEGTFATDKLHERLTESTDQTFGVAHEHTGTTGAYDRYEPVAVPDGITNAPVVAVSDETVVVSQDSDRLNQTIGVENDGQSRLFETAESVTELLEQAGAGDLVIGQVGTSYEEFAGDAQGSIEPDPQFEPRATEDVVASVSFSAEGSSIDSKFALAADELDEDRQETIETSFGTAASDGSGSVDVNENRITATGTYDTEQLRAGPAEQGLTEAGAAELVSPDALAFQYKPPAAQSEFGEFWVTVTEDTDAAAIRAATDSGSTTEIRPQDGSVGVGTSVAVRVDPDGDTVTVFAVNDNGAAGKLMTQSAPTDQLSETAASEAVPEEALSFSYESPDTGDLGRLRIEVVGETEAKTLVAQPQEAGVFTDRVGSLTNEDPVDVGTTLEATVAADGDEVIVFASVDGATGEVARWQGPP